MSQQGPVGPARPKDAQRKMITAGRAFLFTLHLHIAFTRCAHSATSEASMMIAKIDNTPIQQPSTFTSSSTLSKTLALHKTTRTIKPTFHPQWKLVRVISGHLGWVRSAAVEPGNKWFATGAGDRVIKIWDLASGELKLSLTGHISTVRGLAVSPRHPYLFSCGEDKVSITRRTLSPLVSDRCYRRWSSVGIWRPIKSSVITTGTSLEYTLSAFIQHWTFSLPLGETRPLVFGICGQKPKSTSYQDILPLLPTSNAKTRIHRLSPVAWTQQSASGI